MWASCFARGCRFTGAVCGRFLLELPRHLLKLRLTKRVMFWWPSSVTWVSRKSGNSERKLHPCVQWVKSLSMTGTWITPTKSVHHLCILQGSAVLMVGFYFEFEVCIIGKSSTILIIAKIFHWWHLILFVVYIVCWVGSGLTTGWSLVQRSATDSLSLSLCLVVCFLAA
jgi:hypothetical protein